MYLTCSVVNYTQPSVYVYKHAVISLFAFLLYPLSNITDGKIIVKGYTKQQDNSKQAKRWHVVTNRDKVRERRHQVEEVGLVQSLQEVIQLTIHPFQEPRSIKRKIK